jgi:hypothetical protein
VQRVILWAKCFANIHVNRERAEPFLSFRRRFQSETQAIHLALRDLAIKVLPQYEADDGALTSVQLNHIKTNVPQGGKSSVRSSLFDEKIP